jgi:hypothetical protein
MTLELRGDDLVLLDLPAGFTLPERFPVRWCTELQAFAVPRRHGCIPALMRLLREQGLVDEAEAQMALGRRGSRPVAFRSRSNGNSRG